MVRVAESFGASSPGRGERASQISAGEAGWQVGTAYKLVQKPGVEAVPGAYRVHCYNLLRWTVEALGAALRQGSFAAQLYHE